MDVDAAKVCAVFGLPEPSGPLELVQHTVSRTWRLDVGERAYLVKEIWPDEDPFWAGQLVDRMAYADRAAEAGVRQPRLVRPEPSVAFGNGARIDGRGCYRVFEWIERTRELDASDDAWVVATLATLHELERAPADEVRPRYYGLYDRETWTDWIRFGAGHGRSWIEVAARVIDEVRRLTDELAEAYEHAPDRVITHGDFVPSNVLCDPDGPILIDWEAAGPESALHEAGDTLFKVIGGDEVRLRAALRAYGISARGRSTELFDRVIGGRLANLTELLKADVAGEPMTGWKAQVERRDERIAEELVALPGYAAELRELSRRLLAG
ncbi:phosphotransferase family enzyme [Kribbella amoyensis]|uniref:Phosphotransferase family enzyme n=1 Tax=Kribbella amoyensis TaxID=996641 RepID=A0A561B398_9ACTN|nr:aminoglycoside phosphotransferase family protein [Kribbella amoyensis]TWD73346.1 phosphotransferase family enzyme [Kribbella amoyensis]